MARINDENYEHLIPKLVALHPDDIRKIKVRANFEGRSANSIIRELIRRGLTSQKGRTTQKSV